MGAQKRGLGYRIGYYVLGPLIAITVVAVLLLILLAVARAFWGMFW